MLAAVTITLSLVLSLSAAKPWSGYDAAYAQPMAYAVPSYDVHDVVSDHWSSISLKDCQVKVTYSFNELQTKIVDYDYAVNDYYGNEQMRQEHVEPEKQVGHWSARMADGALHSVTYDANSYGNLAHVVIRSNDYAAPAYAAPAYVAPKMHNYEEQNIYVPQTYAAPQTYAMPTY